MTYFFFYHLLKITCKIYFKKINVYHRENIHPTNPLIICANHGNSFMDAILMAIIFKRKMHFLARADAFNTPFKNWFLSKINMMPIYRIRDGREGLKNNDAIFDKCKRILANNGAILIFPEGNCVVEKRIREFKTGFVQLAYESNVENLQVLPVSINYDNPYRFHTEVNFEFLSPITVQEIKADLAYIPFSKILLEMVKGKIAERMIIIPKPEDDEFYEQVFNLIRNDNINEPENIFLQINLSKYLNQLKTDNLIYFNQLKNNLSYYYQQISKYQISDRVIKDGYNYNKKILWRLYYPIYLIAKTINYVPLLLINGIENKIKEPQFLSAVRMVAGMFIYLFYIPLLIIIIGLLINNLLLSALITIGIFAVYYFSFEEYKIYVQSKKLNDQINLYQDLRKKRAELVSMLNLSL